MKALRIVAGGLAFGLVVLGLETGCRPAGRGGSKGSPAAESGGGGPTNDPGVPPGPGFTSQLVIASVAEKTTSSLSLFSVDEGTGTIGQLSGSPANVGAPAGVEASVAFDAARRRLFVASDQASTIAVVGVDAQGAPSPVAGSPFATEKSVPSAMALGDGGSTLYVGYDSSGSISQYAVDDATGALTTLAPAVTLAGGLKGPSAIARYQDLLIVACKPSSSIALLRVAANGTVANVGTAVATETHPFNLEVVGARVYVSLCNCDGNEGAIDAFDIDAAAGELRRIPGAPFRFTSLDGYPHLALHPSGTLLAVSVRVPPQIALFDINPDGSVSPRAAQPLHTGTSGPQTAAWTPDGRFLFVADDSVDAATQGIYVLEYAGGTLSPSAPFRYRVEGGPTALAVAPMQVAP